MVRSITGQSLDTLQRYAEHVSMKAKRDMLDRVGGTLKQLTTEEQPCHV